MLFSSVDTCKVISDLSVTMKLICPTSNISRTVSANRCFSLSPSYRTWNTSMWTLPGPVTHGIGAGDHASQGPSCCHWKSTMDILQDPLAHLPKPPKCFLWDFKSQWVTLMCVKCGSPWDKAGGWAACVEVKGCGAPGTSLRKFRRPWWHVSSYTLHGHLQGPWKWTRQWGVQGRLEKCHDVMIGDKH